MKLAYLILAHEHFEHLVKIVNTLASEEVTFFIHIDSQTEVNYLTLKSQFSDKADVHLPEKRLAINWGGYSMVEGILHLLNEAIKHGHYDYLSLISGQDFPIKSNQTIVTYLQEHAGHEFIEYFSIPDFTRWGPAGGADRYNYYWLVDDLGMERAHLFVQAQRMEGSKRTFPNGWQPYGGSMWFTITYACAKYICEYLTAHIDIDIFFRLTCIPDELLMPSLLLNSPFRKAIVNNNLRYIDWTEGGYHPKTLTIKDWVKIKNSNRHFARKFDYKVDRQIVYALEKFME
ncbi:beta-1,6-N-acetylglucosaminyltransferase [Flavitalea sp. BT771]|uniref:beta-1,6-N-acetylglucosaminyltransferase n=1 Tax=Flavitalea sp. BT771 TaxID=3063329 RepID=UPI0026E40D03|nr:beta-1,6-N-acetylglucosaminyltransferase [Flavitalea sp. BT771]MDO6434595.1 beta-1,6-N-acetylglucosaminyltransferase [Flavitalea sp. BT771]MDV6223495.1 beta-1,6-N-acetylglucosaminyltransferase [Flavitalea sp. BT771]